MTKLPPDLRFKLELIAHSHGVSLRTLGEAVAKLLNGPNLTDAERETIMEIVRFYGAENLVREKKTEKRGEHG